jgi:hypothetical protein
VRDVADELWKRQPWDSAASFAAFRRWLLQDKRPRSLDAAYRAHVGRESDADPTKIRASATWRRWFQARDQTNQPLPGAKTWEARAQAYDDHLTEQDRLKWEQRRRELRESDWQTGEKLREQVNAAIEEIPQFLTTKRRVIKGSPGQPDREVITLGLKLNEVAGAAEVASKLQRLAAEMPTDRQQVDAVITGVTADDLAKARDKAKQLEDELLHGDSGPDGDPDGGSAE